MPHSQRKDIIKEYVSEESYEEIARRCRCTKRTIIRSVNKMREDGEWWEWLERAMLRYGRKKTVSDTAKFNKYADLYAKQFITSKEEHKLEGPLDVTVNIRRLTREDLDSDNDTSDDGPETP